MKPKEPRKKAAPKPKIDRKDWRNLPLEQWNTLTVHAMFADRNRELYGVETYVPMRNWRFEQGVIKRTLTEHGPEVLRQVFDAAFEEYRPTREFPILTAGFVIAYMMSRILPRIQAEQKRNDERERTAAEGPSADELRAWL